VISLSTGSPSRYDFLVWPTRLNKSIFLARALRCVERGRSNNKEANGNRAERLPRRTKETGLSGHPVQSPDAGRLVSDQIISYYGNGPLHRSASARRRSTETGQLEWMVHRRHSLGDPGSRRWSSARVEHLNSCCFEGLPGDDFRCGRPGPLARCRSRRT
jgi:hypothetical protein